MMMKSTISKLFWSTLLLSLFALVGCGPSNSVVDRKVVPSDSLQLTQYLDSALRITQQTNSFLILSRRLVENNAALADIYNINYGRYLILSGQIDTARNHLQDIFESFGDDSLTYDIAKYHNLMAAVETYSKAHKQAVNHFNQAIKIYELHGDHRQASVIKFNLANIFFSRLDYESAYKYASEAKNPLIASQDTAMLTLCLAVLSTATANLGQVNEADIYARQAISLAEQHPNLQGELFANYAMGEVELARKEHESAIVRIQETIRLGEQHQMFQWLIPIRASLLKAYLEAGDYPSAVLAGETLIEQATVFNNRDVLYSTYKNLAQALAQTGEHLRAYNYIKEAEGLFREHMSEANERIIHDMLIQYETEQKSNTILRQESKIAQQRMWGVAGVSGAMLIIFGLAWAWKTQQQKNNLLAKERENAVFQALNIGEERERQRLANELHDGIASNLVAIKLQLENDDRKTEPNDSLLQLVSQTHREVRQVAHNLALSDFEKTRLSTALANLAESFSTPNRTVTFQTNINDQTLNIDKNKAMILYRSVQEFLQNAIKHAESDNIHLQLIKVTPSNYQVSIEDDGVGFDVDHELAKPGSLHSVIERLKNINAQTTVESGPTIGTTVFIELQIVSK